LRALFPACPIYPVRGPNGRRKEGMRSRWNDLGTIGAI
jgi:hypothetical protein